MEFVCIFGWKRSFSINFLIISTHERVIQAFSHTQKHNHTHTFARGTIEGRFRLVGHSFVMIWHCYQNEFTSVCDIDYRFKKSEGKNRCFSNQLITIWFFVAQMRYVIMQPSHLTVSFFPLRRRRCLACIIDIWFQAVLLQIKTLKWFDLFNYAKILCLY